MIKLFENGTKLNFIDDKNAFVGFDFDRQCCEDFGWMVLLDGMRAVYEEGGIDNPGCLDMGGFVFDTDTSPRFDMTGILPGIDLDQGGAVAFRIKKEFDPDEKGWLVLYNGHNGFYHHGWECGKLNVEKEGVI